MSKLDKILATRNYEKIMEYAMIVQLKDKIKADAIRQVAGEMRVQDLLKDMQRGENETE